jgi:hypothetical protein
MGDKKKIGRWELIDLPEWNLFDVPAKTDTGAYSCSIHCDHIRMVKTAGGIESIEFEIPRSNDSEAGAIVYRTSNFRIKKVTNSFGQTEERFIVRTLIRLYGEYIETDFSLSNRKNLRFPVLLGRKLLKRRFLVDVDKRNLSKKYLKKLK